MTLYCPTCSANDLRATTLTDALPAQSCPECRGALLSLIAYRDWRNAHAAPDEHRGFAPTPVSGQRHRD